MPVYVWRDVMCDYSCGMAVVEADTKEKAFNKIRTSDLASYIKEELLSEEPERLEKGEVAYVYGGG